MSDHLPELSVTLEKISAALASNDIPQAVSLAREALDRGNEHPLLFNLRALWFENQKQNREALADLRRAQKLAPEDPTVLNALGLACARADRMAEARGWFADAIEREPRFAPAHFNHGWASEELGDLDVARASFLAHTRLAPDHADPWSRLAALSARLGEWDAARTHAVHALSLDPDHVTARLALASCEAAAKNFAAARGVLDGILASARASAVERALALGQKGDVLHAEREKSISTGSPARMSKPFPNIWAGCCAISKSHLPGHRRKRDSRPRGGMCSSWAFRDRAQHSWKKPSPRIPAS